MRTRRAAACAKPTSPARFAAIHAPLAALAALAADPQRDGVAAEIGDIRSWPTAGVPTAQGGAQWHAATVRQVLLRTS
jgi:hypothetical protein